VEEPLRVCLVTFMFAPLVGGSEVQAEKQARELQKLGQEVMVVTYRHHKAWKRVEVIDGLPVMRVGGMYWKGRLRLGRMGHLPMNILLFFKLWQLRHQYDVLHVLQIGTMAAVTAFIGQITRKPVVVNVPTTGAGEPQSRTVLMADTLTTLEPDFFEVDFREAVAGDISYISRLALGGNMMMGFLKRSAAFYQILSQRSHSYLVSHGFPAKQMVLIPNGVDPEKFSPARQWHRDAARSERTILCVARLQYAKGVDVLLHAWARMLREAPEWRASYDLRLLIVGEGPLRAQLERISVELGIQESVEFLGLRRDVATLLQTAWGFVLPSRWEGMPNALLEAMASGLPCIATCVSGSEDVIHDGINGLLVPPLDPAALAQALRRILEDPVFAQQLAREARTTILEHYQMITIAERLLLLYHSLLKREVQGNPLTV
jgi:glycosyltransferase involved in cell wall biosynthesis